MDIATKYNPGETEDKWYKYWTENKLFHSEPDDREKYSIVIPPPNVTGVLHMGHMLNNTIQDILIRRAKMQGKNTLWLPGTDHASIATEAKVVAKLKSEGIEKSELSRDEFLQHAWVWKEKHGGIILEQLKKLGASCDWERTKFTMDKDLSESVLHVFIDLFEKGKIYRGIRMINWDPKATTAVSDEEVIYKEVQSKLYYVRYKVENTEDEWVTIATTRPETILGDTAICTNPKDERYKHLHGKRVLVPLIKRSIPVIEDEYVDMEFGTGCLKITPAHDINDYEIGIRHKLESIDIFNDNGTLNEKAQIFVGCDRFEARDLIAKELEKNGHLVKIEDYLNKVGFSERTNAVIEPKLSLQWFLKMKELAQPALEAVINDEIKLHPPKFKNTYKHWMENVKDWCISRQLWWGHRIPAYYIGENNEFVVAKNIEEALIAAKEKTGDSSLTVKDLHQDEDVLDTWFSSWLWPISVFDGIRNPDNKDIKYYYPTNDLVTAPEILFFWVARMIIAGYEYLGKKPFENVYLTGIVRDKIGRKMSKQFGNSPDPILLMNKYGADGVRFGMMLCSPAGNDLLFEEDLCEQGRNFANKIWNAFRLVHNWTPDEKAKQPEYAKIAVDWFAARFDALLVQIDKQYAEFRLSEALMTIFKLFRDEFSSWYLELIKPPFGQPIDYTTHAKTIAFFEKLLKVLHPFMPFITEEIWHSFAQRNKGDSIMLSDFSSSKEYDENLISDFESLKNIISKIRTIRKENKIGFGEQLELHIKNKNGTYKDAYNVVLKKANNLSEIKFVEEKTEDAVSFLEKATEFYIPLGDLVNKEEEIKKITEELNYTQGFLKSVQKKLSNEKFVNNAPVRVVEIEKKKQADAEAKIKALSKQLESLQ